MIIQVIIILALLCLFSAIQARIINGRHSE